LEVRPVAITPTTTVRTAASPAATTADRARRIVGTAGSTLSRDELVREVKAGVLVSAPIEGIFESQGYRKGEIKANEYVGRVVANSLGFGMWTVGGALAAAALAPLGLPAFLVGAAGFAAGMVANDLWDRTFGAAIVNVTKEMLPESAAKPLADGFTKFVANPLHDWVWKPVSGFVKDHKVISGVLLAGAALRFPTAAKAVFREVGTMAVGTAAALGIQLGLTDRVLPAAKHRE
jgi:hypothetical protein